MAKRPKRKWRVFNILAMPSVLLGCLFALVADNPFPAGMIGVLLGIVVGVGILAFPDLDLGGPVDSDDWLH